MLLQSTAQFTIKPLRIISLVPSQTELLYHLGLDESIVGITKFCVHPAGWLKSKTIVGGTKNIHLKKINQLNPDLIIGNKEENIAEQMLELSKNYPVWITDIATLKDALQMIIDLSLLTQTLTAGKKIVDEIETCFNQLPTIKTKIKTCYLIWKNPYMTIGGDTFISNMLAYCGFENMYADKKRYPVIEINDLKNNHCPLLLLSSEPYPFKETHLEFFQQLLPDTMIKLVDGEIFSWYGSRLLKAPEYFKQLIQQVNNRY